MTGEPQSDASRAAHPRPETERRIERLYQQVRRWASRWAESPDDAEDLAQETMIRVFVRMDSYRGEARIESWLYRVAKNVAISRWRRRRARESIEWRYGLVGAMRPQWDPLEEAEAVDLADRIFGPSSVLSWHRRRAMEMVCIEGLSAAEVGRRVGVSASSVRSLVCRARSELRATLAPGA